MQDIQDIGRSASLYRPPTAETSAGANWLIVSDVDDTLVGDDEGLAAFVATLRRCPHVRLALNSSRPVASVRRTLADLAVKVEPVAIIGAMGTEIEVGRRGGDQWTAQFTGWSRQAVDAVMGRLGHPRHDEEFQTPWKASYAVPAEARDETVAAIRALESEGLPCRIVRSGQSDFDVLPPGADKGASTVALCDGLGVNRDHLIVAGDSGNDIAMFDAASKGIVVGNARQELRRRVSPDRVFFAERPRAWGLLEGLEYYGVL